MACETRCPYPKLSIRRSSVLNPRVCLTADFAVISATPLQGREVNGIRSTSRDSMATEFFVLRRAMADIPHRRIFPRNNGCGISHSLDTERV